MSMVTCSSSTRKSRRNAGPQQQKKFPNNIVERLSTAEEELAMAARNGKNQCNIDPYSCSQLCLYYVQTQDTIHATVTVKFLNAGIFPTIACCCVATLFSSGHQETLLEGEGNNEHTYWAIPGHIGRC